MGCAEHGEFTGEAVDLVVFSTVDKVGMKRGRTTASCSFSNCRCRSAAVKGRGCLKGPGPLPTPVLSPIVGPAAPVAVVVGILGEARGGDV